MKDKKRILGWFIMIMITVTNIMICCLNFNRAANTHNRETAKDTEPQKIEDHSAESAPSDESEESSIEADRADAALREQLVKEGYLVESDWMIMEDDLELPYADAEAFQFIKDAYAPIEFGGDITSGDPELGIRNEPQHNEVYIFKYIPEDEQTAQTVSNNSIIWKLILQYSSQNDIRLSRFKW